MDDPEARLRHDEPHWARPGELWFRAGHERVEVRFCLQSDGKRKAIADALRAIAAEFGRDLEPGDLIALMDGDTALGEDVLERVLPLLSVPCRRTT